MEWTDQELSELAAFFAKRLTPELSPLDPTDPPPPGDPAKPWVAKLERARDRGRLPSLARDIARAMPEDANLQEACALLQGGPRPQGNQKMWAAALASVLLFSGVAGAGLLALSQRASVEPLQPQSMTVAAVTEPAEAAPVVVPPEVAPVSVVEPGASEEVEAVSELPVEAPEPEVAAAEPVVPAEPAAAPVVPNPTARCAGTPGEVVGYWYAGSKKPGRQGARIKLDRTVNVRADYPDVHNQFDKQAQIQCVLMVGDRVRLDQEPIEVPGQAYWVPLVAGTLEAGA